MKLFYTLLFVVFTIGVSAQETPIPTPTNMEEIPGFKMYPNPAFDDVIYITTSNNAQREVSVYDVFGKVVLRDVITSSRLNIEKLDEGVYVMQVVENDKRITRKLVVK